MKPPAGPIFLARRSFRRRRIGDAARVLPILGVILFMLPILSVGWSTRSGIIFLFVIWAVLIFLSAVLSRLLGPAMKEEGDQTIEGEP